MKPGFVSDSLGGLNFDDLLDTAARLGVSGIEVNTGGWSTAPDFDLATMKESAQARACVDLNTCPTKVESGRVWVEI